MGLPGRPAVTGCQWHRAQLQTWSARPATYHRDTHGDDRDTWQEATSWHRPSYEHSHSNHRSTVDAQARAPPQRQHQLITTQTAPALAKLQLKPRGHTTNEHGKNVAQHLSIAFCVRLLYVFNCLKTTRCSPPSPSLDTFTDAARQQHAQQRAARDPALRAARARDQ